jgi:hypothetical protein
LVSCELRPEQTPEGLDQQLEGQLRSRKGKPSNQSEEKKWVELYMSLFPGELVPSPCELIVGSDNMQYAANSLTDYHHRLPAIYAGERSQVEIYEEFRDYVQTRLPEVVTGMRAARDGEATPTGERQPWNPTSEATEIRNAYEQVVQEFHLQHNGPTENANEPSGLNAPNDPASNFPVDVDDFLETSKIGANNFPFNPNGSAGLPSLADDSGYATLETENAISGSSTDRNQGVETFPVSTFDYLLFGADANGPSLPLDFDLDQIFDPVVTGA